MTAQRTFLGDWIKANRLSRGLSQTQFAKMLGLGSSQALANIESGALMIPVKRVKRFSKVLGVPGEEIIEMMIREWGFRLRDRVRRT